MTGNTHEVHAAEVARLWPVPRAADDKYSRGVLGIVAGSAAYPGAAVLACSGAVRAGAGLVRYLGPPVAQAAVLAHRPEVVCQEAGDALPRAVAWILGPGVTEDALQDRACELVWESGDPAVIDAGAIVKFAEDFAGSSGDKTDHLLLTPHAGELAQALTQLGHPTTRADVEASRLASAERLSDETGATVLLKGSETLVASPGAATSVLPTAVPWLATAGSGDVLAGIAGALLAAGLDPRDAAVCAAFMHARAADAASGGGPIAALDVASALPRAIADLLRSAT